MVDADLLLKKLALIETHVHELRTMAQLDDIDRDVREQRFVVHTLQLAAQAALDTALHIVSDERLGEPQTNRELFDALEAAGWIDAAIARSMRNMAGFRNVVVHGYERVNLDIVRDVVRNHLDDLLAFVAEVRTGLARR